MEHKVKFVRLVKNEKSKSYLMTLPKNFISELGWEKGDYLRVELEGNKIVVYKVEE